MTIVVSFDSLIQSADPSTITEGVATFSSMSFSTNDVVLNFTGVNDQQYVAFNLGNVVSTDGGSGGSDSVRVGYLFGDVNEDRQVRPSDVGLVGSAQLHALTHANVLYDANADGKITPADRGLANANQLKKLPTPE